MARTKSWIALTAALVAGCGRTPPSHVSFDAEFSESQRETLRAAVDAWCDAVGWCPAEAAWSDRGRFISVPSLAHRKPASCPEGVTCVVGGYNDGDNVHVAQDFAESEGLDVLFTIAAHEAGHWCTEHTETGLMSEFHRAEDGAAVVDGVSARAWLNGCR